MKILVDAMSGDHAPLEILKGARLAAKEYKEHEILLVGDQNVISHVAVTNDIDITGKRWHKTLLQKSCIRNGCLCNYYIVKEKGCQ